VLTIGQLARYVGVSTKTVRVYHDKGLLPEPERDASGYRRYPAQAVVELIKIRTLAEAGVPLGRIRELKDGDIEDALQQIDDDLTARIRRLRETQRRLRKLASGDIRLLPDDVEDHLLRLDELGFTARWVAMERDLWIVVYATHPEIAGQFFADQAEAVSDPALRRLYLDYDRAHDLEPDDPFITSLAERIVEASLARYGTDVLQGQPPDSPIPQLLQSRVNAESSAWQHLDTLIRGLLRQATA
jgi:DNA-binding transcriptional MerR regulator